MKYAIVAFLAVFSILGIGIRVSKIVHVRQNCTGYLKRAADANTVPTAKKELSKAIKYLEDNNLTKGYTSICWRTPDEDIEYWFNNLKASEQELEKVTPATSSMEQTNLLMKLRETLIDNSGKNGDTVTVPDGLSAYPNNLLWAIISSLSIITLLFLCLGITSMYVDD